MHNLLKKDKESVQEPTTVKVPALNEDADLGYDTKENTKQMKQVLRSSITLSRQDEFDSAIAFYKTGTNDTISTY
jgi:hypothetical protein